MNIPIILIISLVLFLGCRFLFIFLYSLSKKIFKLEAHSKKIDLCISFAFYFLYILSFLTSVYTVARNRVLHDSEWYLIYTFVGISSILWCYFSWDLKFKSKPVFGVNSTQMIIKKVIISALVIILSLTNGYDTMHKEIYAESAVPEVKVLSATLLVGIFTFDRLLNLLVTYKSLKQSEK